MSTNNVHEIGGRGKSFLNPLLLTAIFCAAGAGFLLQENTHLNHDIAWILYSGQELLDGASFGRDVFAANPPLAWYIAFPAIWAGESLGLSLPTSFRLYTLLIALAIICYCFRRSGRSALLGGPVARSLFLLVLSYFAFIGSNRDFGQREYAALLLSLPYLLLFAERVRGEAVSRTPGLLFGMLAGIGLALKPYFLLVPLLLETYGTLRSRRWFFSLRPEVLGMAAAGLVYALATLVFAPDYFTHAVPMISPFYWGFNSSLGDILVPLWPSFVCLLFVVGFMFLIRPAASEIVLLIAAIAFLGSYVLQMKGYTYHAFPYQALVGCLLSLQLGRLLEKRPSGSTERLPGKMLPALLLGTVGVLFLCPNVLYTNLWYRNVNIDDGPYGIATEELIDYLDAEAPEGRFLALSTHPYPGFPVALYARAEWVGKANSQMFVPAVAKLRSERDGEQSETLRSAERLAMQHLREDLSRQPDIIFVDQAKSMHGIGELPFDFMEFYLEDPTLRYELRRYREAGDLGRFKILKRMAERAEQ